MIKLKRKKLFFVFSICLIIACIILTVAILRKQSTFNILLISIDALRADHLGCYGYNRNTTPNIDRFAKEGVLFEQAISPAPYTLEALASIMTSSYPRVPGFKSVYEYLKEENSSFVEILKNKNYSTFLASSNFIFFEELGYEKGFDFLLNIDDKTVTQKLIDYFKKDKNTPFFAWVHYMAPHAPYTPPEPYNYLFLNDEYYLKEKSPRYLTIDKIPKRVLQENILDIDYYISQYDGEIAFIDSEIGILLKELNNLGLKNDTLVIITADHGEELDEHGCYFTHGLCLYDASIRVPLIIRFPGLIEEGGRIVENQVGTIDIMPTVFDILNIKTKNRNIKGISFLPLLKGSKKNFSKYIFSHFRSGFSVRTGEWKLIYLLEGDKYELYNLKHDPNELNNLVDIEHKRFGILREVLDKWLQENGPLDIEQNIKFTEKTMEKLRNLGYIQ